ncbi:helix-turn-helix domain-containing protein [Corynebacterium cystitidis]|uniref:helix-turn-helix domain-containing protein n=1 Tax=Corynebacterium cystitidis TaxID=35757 RepID=UPI00211EDD01|nr:helix-turn-helix domain-containing protein [Corynebacterium cystitidis]
MNLELAELEADLRAAARDLADAYAGLERAKWERDSVRLARDMKPTFGPVAPTPDRDWSLNLEVSLLKETRDDRVPGGLLVMVVDALSYTSAAGRAHAVDGGLACAHVYRNAYEIAERFPAAQDLLDLMHQQDRYINQQLAKRFPTPQQPPTTEPRQTSTTICKLIGQKGHRITPQHLHTWAQRGHITKTKNGNQNMYLQSEVLAWITRNN